MAINSMGTLPPELFEQQQQLNRQQQMATLLMQQGQQTPQGQMVGNRFVAPSFFQYAAPLLQTYMGSRMLEEGDKQAVKMAKELRKGQGEALADYMGQLQGRPAVLEKVTEMAGPYGVSGAGQNIPMPTAIIPSRPEIKADPLLANLNALQNPYSPEFLRQHAMKKLTEGPKWEKAEYTDEKTGKTRQGVINVNSADPISTFQVGGVKPEMSAYERASLNFRAGDQAIANANLFYNTGMTAGGGGVPTGAPMNAPMVAPTGNVPAGGVPMGNAPAGNVPTANAPAQQDKFAPVVQPQYKYNTSLSPKANQEQAAEFYKTQEKNVTNAKDSFDLMKSASSILASGAPSSGLISNAITTTGEAFNLPLGARKQESAADARLKMISGALTMKQPRFEGPQGVLDVILYQKLAGDLGNANIPITSRLETINEMIALQKKYYPDGDWDSISTKTQSESKADAARSAGKVSVGAPQYATNPTTGERIVSTDGGINWKPAGKR